MNVSFCSIGLKNTKACMIDNYCSRCFTGSIPTQMEQ